MTDQDIIAASTLIEALDEMRRRYRLAVLVGLLSLLVIMLSLAGAVILELNTRGRVGRAETTIRVVSRSPCANLSASACAEKLARAYERAHPSRGTGAKRQKRRRARARGVAGAQGTRRSRPPATGRLERGATRRRSSRPPSTSDGSQGGASSPQPSPSSPSNPSPPHGRPSVTIPPVGPVRIPPVCTPVLGVNCPPDGSRGSPRRVVPAGPQRRLRAGTYARQAHRDPGGKEQHEQPEAQAPTSGAPDGPGRRGRDDHAHRHRPG